MDNPSSAYSAVYNNPNTSLLYQQCPQCAQQSPVPQSSVQQNATQPSTMPVTPLPLLQNGLAQQNQSGKIMSNGAPLTTTSMQPASLDQLYAPITNMNQPMPMTVESLQYLNGFLRTQIGRKVNVQFLIGTNTVTDRTGTLLGVGANYILLRETNTDDVMACDFYTIKFITFYL